MPGELSIAVSSLIMVLVMALSYASQSRAESYQLPAIEKSEVVQSVLDEKGLQKYFHPERKGRLPVVVSANLIGQDLKLKKFESDVIVTDADLGSRPHLRFTKLECTQYYCKVAFEYAVEGVLGSAELGRNRAGKWRVEKSKIDKK